MDIHTTPPVFKNFAATAVTSSVNNNARQASAPQENTKTVAKGDEVKLKKRFKPHPVLNTLVIAAGAVTAFSFAVPALRHKFFKDVNPTLIDISKKNQLSKKEFITFADQVEAKRHITKEYIADRFRKVREIVRRNFFSYKQDAPETLTPVKKFPQKLVHGALNEINEFAKYLRTMSKRVNIDYSVVIKSDG